MHATEHEPQDVVRGGCLCGAVRFLVQKPLREVVNCHCSQCRRNHGHFAAYTAAPWDAVAFVAEQGLAWFRSSASAHRGFCERCGSSLFWELDGDTVLRIAAGSLESPTGLTTSKHIYVDHKSDYYILDDSLPVESHSMLER